MSSSVVANGGSVVADGALEGEVVEVVEHEVVADVAPSVTSVAPDSPRAQAALNVTLALALLECEQKHGYGRK